MRKILTLLFYILMVVSGASVAAHVILYGGRGLGLLVGGFLAIFGGVLIWTDYFSSNADAK
jgi:hypothetical protein